MTVPAPRQPSDLNHDVARLAGRLEELEREVRAHGRELDPKVVEEVKQRAERLAAWSAPS